MEGFEKLITNNFWYIFGFCAVWALGWLGWGLLRRKRKGIFSDAAKNVVYEERTASGRSHKNWYSKLGGAKNCLRLIVTNDELWITPIFPFSALAETFDLDHKILIADIDNLSVTSGLLKKSLLITYKDARNETHVVEVMPRNAERFESALKARMS